MRGDWRRAALAALLIAAAAPAVADRFVIFGDLQDSSADGRARDAALIARINDIAPAFSVYIGDIKEGGTPCTDARLDMMRGVLEAHEAPLIFTPGDNEWTDCWRAPAGSFDPAERKAAVTARFTAPGRSLGQRTMRLEQQPGQRENARWRWQGVVFATLNMPGSNNNLQQTPGAIAEHVARDALNTAWLEQTAAAAADAAGLVLLIHANPQWDARWWEPTGYDRFRAQLAEVAAAFAGPLVVAHGDTHSFRIDKPFARAPHMTRVEVFGPPQRGAVIVDLDPGSPELFRFSPLLLDP